MLKIDRVAGKEVLTESDVPFLKLFKKGKVREVYEIENYLLIVATDRISAFDVVMKTAIPSKGVYLTKQSAFWFKFIKERGFKSHFVSDDLDEIVEITGEKRLLGLPWLKGRVILGKKAAPIPIEAVCRFRIFGSALAALKNRSWIWDKVEIDGDLTEGALIKNGPLFTPTEKSETDEKISFEGMVRLIGSREIAQNIKNTTIELFKICRGHAMENFGFEIADGKVEYGYIDGEPALIDETFTSDSARFIPDKSKESFRKWLLKHNLKGVAAVLPDETAMMVSNLYKSQCDDMKIDLFN